MAEVLEIVREDGVEVMGGGEVESCGLEARQRRNLRCVNGDGVEDHEEALEEKKEEVEFGEEGGRSVYFDQHQGIWKCQHCIWTYQMCFPNIEPVQKHEDLCNALMDIKNSHRRRSENGTHTRGLNSSDQNVAINSEILVQKSLQNEETEFEANEFNSLADFSIKNQSQTSMKMSLDNGSNSYVFSETKTETTTVQTEIEEVVKTKHESKFQVPEFDVERVLEEQETHDLFCPYCKSDITKRVILRKRKRTVQEPKYDVKHKKVPDTNTDLDVTPILPENIDDDKVFRCFECFRFFTIKDGGFGICGIFRTREERTPLLEPNQVPTTKWSWSSIFGPKTRNQEDNRTEHPNEGESDPFLIRIPEPGEHGEQIIPEEKVDDLDDNRTPAKGLSEEPKDVSGKDRPGANLIEQITNEEMPLPDPREVPNTEWSWSSIFRTKTRKPEEKTTGKQSSEELKEHPNEGESDSLLIKIPEPREHVEQIIPEEKVDDLDGNRTPGKDRPDTHLIHIPESEVHEEQIINEEKVVDPTRNKAKGKEMSDEVQVNSDKNKPDAHSIYIPGSEVHGESSGRDFIEDIVKPIGPTTDVNVPTDHGVISIPSSSGITKPKKDQGPKERTRNEWDILKSIVYGGLIESIASLGVVSSAAGSDASTLNIVALGLANLIGGLFVIIHNLLDLKKEQQQTKEKGSEPTSQYWELLGRQKNFRRHVIMAVLSYLIFGLLPPVIYGFSFRKSDNKEYKLIAIAAVSLLCIALLAIGKAHVRLEKDYFKCLTYYIGLGVTGSGLSYVAGVMIHRFLDELGLFDPLPDHVPAPPFDGFLLNGSKSPFSSSY